MKSHEVDDFLLYIGAISSSPQIHLPTTFQIPKIRKSDKFKGFSHPKQHLRRYLSLAKIEDLIEKKIMYAFPLSLSGHAAEWYDSVEVGKTKVWGRLIEEFIKQFFYNTLGDVTLTNLEITKQKISKTFSEFLIRWREKNSKMISRTTEKDQVHMIIKNLLPF
jgi:hypothetical protein